MVGVSQDRVTSENEGETRNAIECVSKRGTSSLTKMIPKTGSRVASKRGDRHILHPWVRGAGLKASDTVMAAIRRSTILRYLSRAKSCSRLVNGLAHPYSLSACHHGKPAEMMNAIVIATAIDSTVHPERTTEIVSRRTGLRGVSATDPEIETKGSRRGGMMTGEITTVEKEMVANTMVNTSDVYVFLASCFVAHCFS